MNARTLRKWQLVEASATVAGVDIRRFARKCWAALHPERAASDLPMLPLLIVRRSARRRGVNGAVGTAWHASYRVTMTMGPDVDRAKVFALVLHELTHHAVGPGHAHGTVFNHRLSQASIALWQIGLPIVRGYAPTRFLTRALRACGPAPRDDQKEENSHG